MRRDQVMAYINANCKSEMTDDDFSQLEQEFEEYDIEDINSFKLEIHLNPLYNIISGAFYRDPDQYGNNSRRSATTKLENFIPLATIETINYYDYVGEKIYKLVKQDDDEIEEKEADFIKPTDLHEFLIGLSQYLINNNLNEYHNETLMEISKLKRLNSFALKYNLEMGFLDGYLWQ